MNLPAETHLGYVHLRVTDIDRALLFYETTLGFRIRQKSGNTVHLSATGSEPDHLILTEQKGAVLKPRRTTGLYHVAVRLPNREALARTLRRLVERNVRIHGASDHGVSEAIYLADPDGNGLELYTDRPREAWPRAGSELAMVNAPLGLDDLLAMAKPANTWKGIDSATDIGHVHLQVGDLEKTEELYHKQLGFEVTARLPGAIFLAAGGYHHHIGANTWAGVNLPRPPENAAGLIAFSIVFPATNGDGTASNRSMHDPDGHLIELDY